MGRKQHTAEQTVAKLRQVEALTAQVRRIGRIRRHEWNGALLADLLFDDRQLAITSGAMSGGLAFDTSGYRTTFALSAVILVAASIAAGITARLAYRK